MALVYGIRGIGVVVGGGIISSPVPSPRLA